VERSEVLFLLFFSFLSYTLAISQSVSCSNSVQTYICLPSNYSSMDIPVLNKANLIKIEIHISDVLVINDRDFSITYSLYFNVHWWDPRIHVNKDFFKDRVAPEPDTLTPVDLNLINDLWVPNVFIYNLKTFQVIDVLSRLAGLWVSPDKDIMYSQASQITFICPMIFNYFPLDTQVCKFQVGSYSYNMEKMVFKVAQLGYAHTSRSIVLDYDIRIKPLDEEDKVFQGGSLGNFSLAGFEMILTRHVSHYIITYYLPSGLFVVVSWISFLVPADVIPGRMALLVTLFLVLVNIFNNVTTNTPKAEGLTAIEAWMLACILFVFAALAEYAVLLFHKSKVLTDTPPNKAAQYQAEKLRDSDTWSEESIRRRKNSFKMLDLQPSSQSTNGESVDRVEILPLHQAEPETEQQVALKRKKMYTRVDRFFLVTFPLMFLVFNGVYWFTYLQFTTLI